MCQIFLEIEFLGDMRKQGVKKATWIWLRRLDLAEQAGGGDHEDHEDHQDCQQEGQAGGLEWLRSSCPSLLKALCAVGRPVAFSIYFYCSPTMLSYETWLLVLALFVFPLFL